MKPWALAGVMVALGCSSETAPPHDATVLTDASSEDVRASDRGVDARSPTPRCVDDVPSPYPGEEGVFDEGHALPPWTFSQDSGRAPFAFASLYTPCVVRSTLVVIRVLAAWSGPAQYAVAHTADLRALNTDGRLQVVDLLVRSEDNRPVVVDDVAAWRARYDVAPDVLALDPEYRFQSLYLGGGQLPIVMLVDPRTMRPLRVLVAPDNDELASAVGIAMAQLDGLPMPPRREPTRIDGRFSADRWAMIRAMSPLGPAPVDSSNRVSGNAMAAALGRTLFDDAALSSNGTVSCATCHVATAHFTDGRPLAVGLSTGTRNTPDVSLAAYQRWLFWDGRADSLWSQALGPMENPAEMDGDRMVIARRVTTTHRAAYESVYGAPPSFDDASRFPAHARPGTTAWSAMREADQQAVTTVFVNVGKALGAFERTLAPPETPFDRYARGEYTALTEEARAGLLRFFDFGCVQCHHGPTLSDGAFHNVGMPTGRSDGLGDEGRIEGLALWAASPFRRDGRYSDLTPGARVPSSITDLSMRGQFRTPSLRGAGATGPWGHGGTFATLDAVMEHYAHIGAMPNAPGSVGPLDLHLPQFHMTADVLTSLSAFVRALQ